MSKPDQPEVTITNARRVCYALLIIVIGLVPTLIVRAMPIPYPPLVPAGAVFFVILIAVILLHRVLTKGGKGKLDAVTNTVLGTATAFTFLASIFITDARLAKSMLSNPTGMLMPLTMFIALPGLQLLIFALRHRRTGDSLHCPKCDYELGVSPDDAPIRCPECGTAWLGRWRKGASRRSPALALVGALLVLSGVLPWALKLTALGSASLAILPTTTLISVTALDPWGHNKDAWAELNARKLTPQETDRLAEKLLNLRLSAGYLYGQPASWLDSAVTSNSISQPLIDRYYADWFEAKINLPESIPQGQSESITITAEDRKGGPAAWMYIWIQSVSIDGVAVTGPSFYLNPRWYFSLDFTDPTFPSTAWRSNDTVGVAPLDTSQPGTRTIKITAYRCVVPRASAPAPLTFSNSKPLPPANSLHFAEFTIEKTVTITPP